MRRVIITGGTYSGKTTLVEALGKKGYKTIPESAMQLTGEMIKRDGVEKHRKQKKDDPAQFLSLVAERQLNLEKEIRAGKDEYVFQDRSYYDYIAFCKLLKVETPKNLLEAAEKQKIS